MYKNSSRRYQRFVSLVGSVGLTAIFTSSASAQDADSAPQSTSSASGLEEVVVTAQKRSESVQRTALAVTALSAEGLASRDITNVAAIAREVPGLNVTEQIGQARITLRGIGVDNISTGAEGSIAFNQDGVFYSRSSGALASFYDLSRIEVLRGPQGTLYGRNATGGSVNLISAPPTDVFEGYFSVTGGNYSTFNSEGALSGPLGETVSGRLSFQTQHRDGYGKNLVTGNDVDSKESQAVRAQLQFDPSERLSVLIKGDYYRSDDSSNGYHHIGAAGQTLTGEPVVPTGLLLGGFVPRDPHDLASASDPKAEAEFYGALVNVFYRISDIVSLRSLSSIRKSDFTLDTDIAPQAINLFPIYLAETSTQPSQELQLNVETDRNKFVAGLYYLREKIRGSETAPFNLLAVGGPDLLMQGFYAGGVLETEAAAVYGQNTFSINDAWRVTVGGRYSWEKKEIDDQSAFDLSRPYSPANSPLSPHHIDDKTFSAFTPKVGLEYDVGPETMAYASYSKGFKAGTYNLGNASEPLDPEKVGAFEAGLKTTLLDQRLRANLAGFHYDYEDLQVGKVQNTQLILENAASATIYGVEAEIAARPIEPLLFSLTASWLHARFDRYVTQDQARPGGDGVTVDPESGNPAFDLRGKALPQAPDYTINLAGEYTWSTSRGDATARWETFWSDQVYFSPFNREEVSQGAYSLSNLFVDFELPGRRWRLSAFLRNVFDEDVVSSGQIATTFVGSPVVGYLAPPRTYGLTARYNF